MGYKVHKGNTYPMSQDSVISFIVAYKRFLKFVSNLEVLETFPLNIITLEDIIQTPEKTQFVPELSEAGELIEVKELNDSLTKTYFKQIVIAIEYLHSRKICHRDLKLENILSCSENQNNPSIKIRNDQNPFEQEVILFFIHIEDKSLLHR